MLPKIKKMSIFIKMTAVEPVTSCPHAEEFIFLPTTQVKERIEVILSSSTQKCTSCENAKENWVCLKCHDVYCGRFVSIINIFKIPNSSFRILFVVLTQLYKQTHVGSC